MNPKRFAAFFLSALMILTITAAAADDESNSGFIEIGGVTNTHNEYFFEIYESVLIDSKEATQDIDFDEIYAGSDLYIPLHVYVDGGKKAVPATDKQLKTDDVTVSSKVMTGKQYVGNIEVVDGKKLKIDGVEAGPYVKIPFSPTYEGTSRTAIRVNLVLSVNGVTYQDSQIVLKCFLRSRLTEIMRNTVYGAKIPTRYKVWNDFSGEVTFEFVDKIKYSVRVKRNEGYYLNLSRENDAAIAKLYPDATLEFYNFKGNEDSFQSKGNLEIPVDRASLSKKDEEPSLYVYRINSDNTLTSLSAGVVSYDGDKDILTIKTQTLDNYVLSNTPLKKEIDKTESNILKSGYASAVAESSDTEAQESGGTSGNQQGGGTASSGASANQQSETVEQGADSYAYDDDGYVPEEGGSYENDNLNMGLPINAANRSADNPSTSDLPLLPVCVIGAVISALVCFKKFPSAK